MAFETDKGPAPNHILATPIWLLAIRGFQFLLALIIVGLSGRLMHDAYLDEEGLAVAIGLFTWIIVLYIVLTEKISSLHKGYNIIAVLALDGFLVILWLATFAAVAAERARYTIDVSVNGCFDDGGLIDSKTCGISKRGVILFETGKAMLSAIAGLGALVWLLFIATFVWTLVMFLRARKEGRFQFGSSTDAENHQMEAKPQSEPFIAQQQQQQQPIQPQHTGQYPPPAGSYPAGAYPPQGQYPQAGYQGGPVSPQAMSPVQQQGAYPPPQELYGQQQEQYAPQQGYYPPQQQPVPAQHTGSELAGSEGQQRYGTPYQQPPQ